MEQSLKQRLVGGIVLVALLLILVPAILDFSQESRPALEMAEIPEAPDTMKMEVLPLEIWSEKIEPEIDNDNQIIETPAQSVDSGASGAAKITTARTADKPAPAAAAVRDTASTPALPEGASAWVVQIASFSDQEKAFALRDKLRQADHPAFIERSNSDGQTIFRVKVGPVLQRNEADKRQAQIARAFQLNGLVMQYR